MNSVQQYNIQKVHLSKILRYINEVNSFFAITIDSPKKEFHNTHYAALNDFLYPDFHVVNSFNIAILQGEYYHSEAHGITVKISLQIKKTIQNLSDALKPFSSLFQEEITGEVLSRLGISDYSIVSQIESLVALKNQLLFYSKYNAHLSYLSSKIRERLFVSKKTVVDVDLDPELETVFNKLNEFRDIDDVDPSVIEYLFNEADYFSFLVNIKLAELDEGYLCSNSILDKLITLSARLEVIIDRKALKAENPITLLILYKCKYLLLKVLRRFEKDDKKEYTVAAASKFISYDVSSLSDTSQIGDFSLLFDSDSKSHYSEKKTTFALNNSELSKRAEKALDNLLNSPSVQIRELHFLCKYYKKNFNAIYNSYNSYQLDGLIKDFKRLLNRFEGLKSSSLNDDLSDYFAYETGSQLVANTAFKIISERFILSNKTCESIALNFDTVADEFNFFQQRCSGRLPNFQLHRNFCSFIESLLSSLASILDTSPQVPDGFNLFVDKLIKRYFELNEALLKLIRESEKNALMPIYLTMSECIKLFKRKESNEAEFVLQIFLDSSYILPSNYDYLYRENEFSVLKVKNFDSLISHRLFNAQIKQQESKFDQKVKDHQLNIIQVIGLYAAFITFSLGSVSIIPKFEKSYYAIFLFMFVFAVGLSFFILVLRLILNSKSNDTFKRDLSFAVVFITLIIVSASLIFSYKNYGTATQSLEQYDYKHHVIINGKDSVTTDSIVTVSTSFRKDTLVR